MSFTAEIAEELLVRSGRCCCLCRKFKGTKLEIHHILPQADGGTDDLDNGIPLCFDCHADVQSYNNRHPKGRRIRPSELRRHRDLWFAHVATGTSNTRPNVHQPVDAEDRLFECGIRVKEVREELGLTASEFIEKIGWHSERHLNRIENGADECPESIISSISGLCSVSEAWLKTGKGQKYKPAPLLFWFPDDVVAQLKELDPTYLYFCLETRTLRVLLVVDLGEYRWQVFDPNLQMNFWEWMDDQRYIGRMYRFIERIYDAFTVRVQGRIISTGDLAQIAEGMLHPYCAVSLAQEGIYWSDDILAFYWDEESAKHYQWLYGKWFCKVQDEFRKYAAQPQ